MAWIESHQELGHHPKLKRLCRVLKVSPPEAVGHLHYLWWWAADYCEDGDLSRFESIDVAIGAMWDGEEDVFLDALEKCGFVDRSADDRLVLHDWDWYFGRLLQRRQNEALRKRERRGLLPNVRGTSGGRPADGAPPSGGYPADGAPPSGGRPGDGVECPADGAQYPTVPNLTVPNPTNTPLGVEAGASTPISDVEPSTVEGSVEEPVEGEAEEPSVEGVDDDEPPTKAKSKVARQFPDDFYLDDDLLKYASDKGFDSLAAAEMFEHFRNHHEAKGSRMVNWRRAWYTWVLNQKTRFAPRNGVAPTSAKNGRQSNANELAYLMTLPEDQLSDFDRERVAKARAK